MGFRALLFIEKDVCFATNKGFWWYRSNPGKQQISSKSIRYSKCFLQITIHSPNDLVEGATSTFETTYSPRIIIFVPGTRIRMPAIGCVVTAVCCAAVIGNGIQVITAGCDVIGGVVAHVQPLNREVHRDIQFAPKPLCGWESLQI